MVFSKVLSEQNFHGLSKKLKAGSSPLCALSLRFWCICGVWNIKSVDRRVDELCCRELRSQPACIAPHRFNCLSLVTSPWSFYPSAWPGFASCTDLLPDQDMVASGVQRGFPFQKSVSVYSPAWKYVKSIQGQREPQLQARCHSGLRLFGYVAGSLSFILEYWHTLCQA